MPVRFLPALAGALLLVGQQGLGVHTHRHSHDLDAEHSHRVVSSDAGHEVDHDDGAVDEEPGKHGSREAPGFAVIPTLAPFTVIAHARISSFARCAVGEPRVTGPPHIRPPSQAPPASSSLT